MQPKKRYPLVLLVVLLLISIPLAIHPNDRATWVLENALAIAGVGILVATYHKFPLSRVSYTLIFLMLVLHEVGAHYTYSVVPYDEWFERLTGKGLNERFGLERNQYDRFVHFSYGLLLAYPIRELVVRVANVRGFWGYFFPLDVVISTSATYELLEWAAAAVFGDGMGQTFLGTQGDEWDAHKDMLLAMLGALIALTVTALIHLRLSRDFQREWADSLRVHRKQPLGEVELARLRKS